MARLHREEQILVLSGGLTIHNLRDFSCFAEDTAKPLYLDFDKAILEAVALTDVCTMLCTRVVYLLTNHSPQSVRPLWSISPDIRDLGSRTLELITSCRCTLQPAQVKAVKCEFFQLSTVLRPLLLGCSSVSAAVICTFWFTFMSESYV